MILPYFQSEDQVLNRLQTKWKSEIDPVLANPLNGVSIIKNVSLVSGTNVVNHLLGKPLQGWFIIRQRASASIYDKQDSNQTPGLTLVLNSSAAVSVDLAVF